MLIDDIQSNLGSNVENVKDDNLEIGKRVKQYTLVSDIFNMSYFDNYLRFKKGIILRNLLLLTFIFSYIFVLQISIFTIDNQPTIYILKDSFLNWSQLCLSIVEMFLNSWTIRLNMLIEELDLVNEVSVYPLAFITLVEVNNIPPFVYNVLIGFEVLLVIYMMITLYHFHSQKLLFNSLLIHMYIPTFFLFSFYKRETNKYMYIKLLKHQKNKVISLQQHKLVIMNLFNLTLDNNDKVDLILQPKRFLYFYDYYKIYYIIEDDKQEKPKKEVIAQPKKEKTKTPKTSSKIDINKLNSLKL